MLDMAADQAGSQAELTRLQAQTLRSLQDTQAIVRATQTGGVAQVSPEALAPSLPGGLAGPVAPAGTTYPNQIAPDGSTPAAAPVAVAPVASVAPPAVVSAPAPAELAGPALPKMVAPAPVVVPPYVLGGDEPIPDGPAPVMSFAAPEQFAGSEPMSSFETNAYTGGFSWRDPLQEVAAFASGGFHTGGLRLVGENGPELEATGPSRIFNAAQTADMLSGAGGQQQQQAMAEELRALRVLVTELLTTSKNALDAGMQGDAVIAGNTGKLVRLLEGAMPDGDAIATREVVDA
jgi:hypothetical protein